MVFVNGLPLDLIELKNAADEDAGIWAAYPQMQARSVEEFRSWEGVGTWVSRALERSR